MEANRIFFHGLLSPYHLRVLRGFLKFFILSGMLCMPVHLLFTKLFFAFVFVHRVISCNCLF